MEVSYHKDSIFEECNPEESFLIVEPDPAKRARALLVAKASGCKVVFATNTKEAFSLLENNDWAGVITASSFQENGQTRHAFEVAKVCSEPCVVCTSQPAENCVDDKNIKEAFLCGVKVVVLNKNWKRAFTSLAQ